MPRERISDESGFAAHVVWTPDQHVQLATLSNNPKEFVAWCRQLVEDYDRASKSTNPDLPDLTGVSDGMVLGAHMGMFWSPDRHQINQLIRVLRRARNAVYGADE